MRQEHFINFLNKTIMSTFQERLSTEKVELDEKVEKLQSFIKGENFTSIDTVQQSLLRVQLDIMMAYSQVLSERLTYLMLGSNNS